MSTPPRHRRAPVPLLRLLLLLLLLLAQALAACTRHDPERTGRRTPPPPAQVPQPSDAPEPPAAAAEPEALPPLVQGAQPGEAVVEPVADEVALEPLGDVPAGIGELQRLAFGSCLHQDKPQPIWDAVLGFEPQLFVLLGDNVYADSTEAEGLRAAYRTQATRSGFRRLRERIPVLATWDDHDFGVNDMGGEHPNKAVSQAIFLEFFPAVARTIEAEAREDTDGIYSARIFGPPGRRVQLVLLDTRFHRSSPLRKASDVGLAPATPASGPYVPLDDTSTTMLGEAQWRWLEARLAEPAEVRLLASSIQVLAEGGGWEAWSNLPHERERLLELLGRTEAQALVLLSGDMHWAELSRVALDGRDTPLVELTSSGLTEAWHTISPNAHRVTDAGPATTPEGAVTGANFGTLEITWPDPEAPAATAPRITLAVRDAEGRIALQHTLEP